MAKFKKGQSGNPAGRPKAPEIQYLRDAIAAVEKKKKKKLYQHLVEQAFEDNTVLLAVVRKFVPDMKQSDLNINIGEHLMSAVVAALKGDK